MNGDHSEIPILGGDYRERKVRTTRANAAPEPEKELHM
jgi:hypothetical protein